MQIYELYRYSLSDTAVQKSLFTVYLNRAQNPHPDDVKPQRHDQVKSSDDPTVAFLPFSFLVLYRSLHLPCTWRALCRSIGTSVLAFLGGAQGNRG